MTRLGGSAQATLLVVDDDDTLRERLVRAFCERGYDCTGAANGEGALELARSDPPELAVVDLRMPGCSGLEVVRGLLALDPATQVVVLTGYGSIATAIEALRAGARNYLTKPTDADAILLAFESSAAACTPESYTPSLARTEWEHIQRVLADVNGNVSRAARRLKVHRRSLQRKLSKYPPRA